LEDDDDTIHVNRRDYVGGKLGVFSEVQWPMFAVGWFLAPKQAPRLRRNRPMSCIQRKGERTAPQPAPAHAHHTKKNAQKKKEKKKFELLHCCWQFENGLAEHALTRFSQCLF
jgi:hypothetical protein